LLYFFGEIPGTRCLGPNHLDIRKEEDSESHPVALKPWHAKCQIWVTAQIAPGATRLG
jgi:hypothetical protein